MLRDIIKKEIQRAVEILYKKEADFDVSASEHFGDYSSNAAMVTKEGNAIDAAENIKSELLKSKELQEWIEKIEVAGAGFLNFYLKREVFEKNIAAILKEKENYGKSGVFSGKKIMVEYTDPNPFKEFHIGHLYSNTVGESLARIAKSLGADIKRACYQGDIGMHVAKSIWGMMEKLKNEKLKMNDLMKKSLNERQHFMGQAYALGAEAFEKSEKTKKEIEELNKKIYAGDSEVEKYYEMGRKWSLEYFETIYKRLGTKFDFYYFESETGKSGLEFVKEYLKKGVFKESDGAVIFEGEKYGLHNRVFINSLGLPTYEAKDLGLAPKKYQDFPYDLSIIVTGNEVNEYFKVILKALEIINPDLAKKTKHIGHGMVRLPSGKMSSRSGDVLTGEWLLEEAKKRLKSIIKEGDNKDIEAISEKTAVAAVKYSLLKSNIGKDVIFDFNESLAFDGNSGPYLQYTYARCKSVLNKAQNSYQKGGQANVKTSHFVKTSRDKQNLNQIQNLKSKMTLEELAIVRTLYKFPEVVVEAGKNFAPNLICNFLFDLAQKFNLFYQKVSIIGSQDSDIRNQRLLITKITADIIKQGLNLLGIEVLEQM